MPGTPQSLYQSGGWTVTRLKDELRSRNLSPKGKKPELIARLEQAESGSDTPPRPSNSEKKSPEVVRLASPHQEGDMDKMNLKQLKEELKQLGVSSVGKKADLVHRLQEAQNSANPFMDKSKSPATPQAASRTPSKASERSSALSANDIGLLTCPLTTIAVAARGVWSLSREHVTSRAHALTLVNCLLVGSFVLGVSILEGPHQAHMQPIHDLLWWYGRWIFLGILSSVGLGTGAHTFLLFLGPFIAQVTTAAYVCKTVEFPLTGPHALLCPAGFYKKMTITLPMILNKVKWEAFAWGLGTAIGELPPYLVARASAIAGNSAGEMSKVEKLLQKSHRTCLESLQLASYSIVARLGFFGILFLASIPNPLFDLAGIMSGYFMVPFVTFISALFFGKAIIKAGLQTTFVIFLFSRDYLDLTMTIVQKRFPSVAVRFHEWIVTQRTVFQERRPHPLMETIGTMWHILLIVMMCCFVLSVFKPVALMQARREGLIQA